MDNENKVNNPNIKTFADDMAEAIEADREGAVRKIIHEQEIKEKEKINISPDSRRNKLFMSEYYINIKFCLLPTFNMLSLYSWLIRKR